MEAAAAPRSALSFVNGVPTICNEGRSGHKTRLIRQQEHGGLRDFLWLCHALESMQSNNKFMKLIFLDEDMSVLENIERVVADSDLDGLMAAAVLKSSKPSLEVHFAHPALIRAGVVDHLIDENTAICDLPFHPDCGLYLDHHLTNKPSEKEEQASLKMEVFAIGKTLPLQPEPHMNS